MMQYEPMTAEDKAIMKEFLQTPYYKVLKKACDTKLNDLMNELITLKKVENIDSNSNDMFVIFKLST